MYRTLLPRHSAALAIASICALVLAASFVVPASWAQNSSAQYPAGQYPPGTYPPGRPVPIAV